MELNPIPVPEPVETNCKNCQKPIFAAERFCTACGFPVNATKEEEDHFYYTLGAKKLQLDTLDRKIHNARIAMWVISGATLLFGFIFYMMNKEHEAALGVLISNVIVALLFVLLAELAKKKPFVALLSGLLLYVTLHLYAIIVENMSPFSGIIIKVIIIVYLVKGIRSAQEAEQIKKEINA